MGGNIMKKIGVVVVMLAVILFSISEGQADVKEKAFSVTPFVGVFTFEGDQNLDTKPVYGIRAGYELTKHWALEGVFDYLRTEPIGGSDSVYVYNYRAEALYNFEQREKGYPTFFLAVGVGGQTIADAPAGIDSGSDAVADYGAGFKYFLTENLALRGDIRHIVVFNSEVQNNLECVVGLTYYWGGEKAKATPEPVRVEAAPVVVLDADKDGVVDDEDKCPDTPEGVKVDREGCPLDTDADGVADYEDKCPDTPKGVKVDKEGCPLDTDADGVADYEDKCPDTPKGVKVDREGCPVKVDVGKEMVEKGRVTLDIKFDFNKAVVKPECLDQINKIAEVMKQYPAINVVIEGHTDSLGSEKANIQLSSKRADAVKAKLVEMGVDSARIRTIGYGFSKPVATNATAAGRKLNRRVEAAVEYEIKK
jgi:OOP family OmpA-OmpF porin